MKDLTPEENRILKEKGTEAPFSSPLNAEKGKGMYTCKGCGAELFSSETKFDSGSGWPSFYDLAHNDSVDLLVDRSGGVERTEVVCSKCKGHLGHVFNDGPTDKTGKRYCINGTCLAFEPTKDK
ncbi:peptide-methionine (R)-S-oxide reductase [Candidatus Wolfebacteria bacterium]|nr:MAG: peptide-methionine (R)-S-oxide reductase [Candidatus Wolfebacteria bacterium]